MDLSGSTSSSSSSSSSSSPNVGSPWSMPSGKSTFRDHADKFLDGPQRSRMEQLASRYDKVVCQVLRQDKKNRGTGFLIGPCLLITNHHVLPNHELAKDGFACFFRVTSRSGSSDAEKSNVETMKIRLDPDRFFFTSPNRPKDELLNEQEKYLDFTVVALKPESYLSTTSNIILSLFDTVPPKVHAPVCLLQYPEVMKPDDALKGNLKSSYGNIRDVLAYSITYTAPTFPGSSGGAVIDSNGTLMALHQGDICIPNKNPLDPPVYESRGVSIHAIAARLISKGKREIIEELNKTPLPPDLSAGNVIGLPQTTELFTGREEELRDLEKKCSGEGKRVAVVGLGGIGKTALAIKYANDHQSDYSLICLIQSGTTSQIENGLLNLAGVLEIREENRELTLLALRTKLERNQDRLLVIFDGVDDEKTLVYVCEQLPKRGCTSLLVSSRLQGSAASADFSQLPLRGFTKEEAVAFLLKAVGEKDTNTEQAAILAEELSYLPLALKHAAAFIKSKRGYTFGKYLEGLRNTGVNLLGPDYVPKQGTREETILTTWKKSMGVILQAPFGPLATDLLHFFSLFAEAPIPMGILDQQRLVEEQDVQVAIGHLIDYSLLEEREDTYMLHGLLQKVIRHAMPESYRREYIHQGLKAFCDFSHQLDANDSKARRRLDPCVPHIEMLLEGGEEDTEANRIWADPLLDALWNYYQADGKYDESKRVAKIYEKWFKDDPRSTLIVAKGLFFLGSSLVKLGDYETALVSHEEALELRKRTLEARDKKLIKSYLSVGETLYLLGRRQESRDYYQYVHDCYKDIIEKQDLNTTELELYQSLGESLWYLNEYEESLKFFLNWLKSQKQIFGDDHPKTADSYREVGATLGRLGRHDEALPYKRRALEIRKQTLGDDHPKTAESYFGVGLTLRNLGKHDEALFHLQRALEIHKQKLGDGHLKTAESYRLVGIILCDLGMLDRALSHLQHALETHKQELSESHPEIAVCYHEMGRGFHLSGQHDKAVLCLDQALKIRTECFGKNGLKTADTYYRLGVTLTAQERYGDALVYAQKALEIHTKSLGSEHPETSNSHNSVQTILSKLAKQAQISPSIDEPDSDSC